LVVQRSQRLNRRQQFSALYRYGTRVDTVSFSVIYRQNHLAISRFATVVNRRFGTAVRRNKVKRVARSLFNEVQRKIAPACDLLVLPKITMLTQKHAELVSDFERALKAAELFRGQP
jgi:ribonuclease P protein component